MPGLSWRDPHTLQGCAVGALRVCFGSGAGSLPNAMAAIREATPAIRQGCHMQDGAVPGVSSHLSCRLGDAGRPHRAVHVLCLPLPHGVQGREMHLPQGAISSVPCGTPVLLRLRAPVSEHLLLQQPSCAKPSQLAAFFHATALCAIGPAWESTGP